ncbi:MAG: TIGR02679 family protein [Proteobacteria bacterium]|nr:TIGR02679 family protein [Pseudomonadota bacterium]
MAMETAKQRTASPTLDLSRLQQTLASQDLAWLLERLRQRLTNGQALRGVITLRRATSEQRDAVDRLLGRPPSRGTSLSVELEQLEAKLKNAELCSNLTEAVEALIGQVTNARDLRLKSAARWRELFDEEHRQYANGASQHNWLDDLQSSGLLRRLSGNRLSGARELLIQTRAVLAVLPCRGLPLAELAATTLGSSHALDAGSPVATLVLRSIVESEIKGKKARRDAWASLGVMLDELSSPVLTLNLTADNESLTGRSLNLYSSVGEPCRTSIRQLLRHPPRFRSGETGPFVYVCENPTVVSAAANRLGMRSAPLVCIEGQPKTAATILLRGLVAAGVQLKYHGDFDWSGIQIANLIVTRHGATSWQFGAEAYARHTAGTKLVGTPVPACWDDRLTPAMLSAGRAIHEEQVLSGLLDDLAVSQRFHK